MEPNGLITQYEVRRYSTLQLFFIICILSVNRYLYKNIDLLFATSIHPHSLSLSRSSYYVFFKLFLLIIEITDGKYCQNLFNCH